MKKYFFLLPLIILATTSCKKKLDREDAKQQIVNSANYPLVVDYSFTNSFTKDFFNASDQVVATVGEEEWEKAKTIIEGFKNAGLVTFEETPQRKEIAGLFFNRPSGYQTWTDVKVFLTDEGKKYLLKENNGTFKVKLWETNLTDITGIQEMEQDKRAKVDYTISNSNITPFGETFSNKTNTISKTIYFSLYDDGWRIQN